MSTDNDTQKNPVSVGFSWIFTLLEGRVKFVFGAFWFVLAIIILNAAWVEISGKKQSMVQSLTATGIVEVLNSTVWILPKSTIETELDPDRIYHEEDIIDDSEYTLFPIDVAQSRSKDIYGRFKLSNTPEKNKTFALAMQDISSQITSQIRNFPTRDLFQFYRVLKAHMRQQRKGWDGPLLQSTKEMAVDTSRSANLRSWIISVLSSMCYALKDPELTDFMYSQYISCKEDVRKYWRRNIGVFYQSHGFREDIMLEHRHHFALPLQNDPEPVLPTFHFDSRNVF